MKQVVQSYKTGKLVVMDVPAPAVRTGLVLVKNVASLVSARTEKEFQARLALNFHMASSRQSQTAVPEYDGTSRAKESSNRRNYHQNSKRGWKFARFGVSVGAA